MYHISKMLFQDAISIPLYFSFHLELLFTFISPILGKLSGARLEICKGGPCPLIKALFLLLPLFIFLQEQVVIGFRFVQLNRRTK
jgi:hypothetical protein